MSHRACLGLPPQNHMQLEYKMQKSFNVCEDKNVQSPVATKGNNNVVTNMYQCVDCGGATDQKTVDR